MRATRLGLAPWRWVLTAVSFLIAGWLAHANPGSHWTALLVGLVTAGVLIGGAEPSAPLEQGTVTLEQAGLLFGDRRVQRSEIRRARVTHVGTGAIVAFDRGHARRALRLQFHTLEEAHNVVTSLQLDAGRVRDRFRTLATWHRSILVRLFAWAAAIFATRAADGPIGVGAVMALAAAWFVVEAVVYRLEVGPDGIFVRTLLGSSHVPAARVLRVERAQDDAKSVQLLIHCDGYRRIAVWVPKQSAGPAEARIVEMLQSRTAREPRVDAAELLLSQSPAELRALGGAETFRDARIDREALLALVEDAGVDARLRARAAIAAASFDDLARQRIRVAAEHSTLPQLRVVLAASAAGDDVDALLVELEKRR